MTPQKPKKKNSALQPNGFTDAGDDERLKIAPTGAHAVDDAGDRPVAARPPMSCDMVPESSESGQTGKTDAGEQSGIYPQSLPPRN